VPFTFPPPGIVYDKLKRYALAGVEPARCVVPVGGSDVEKEG
jgi:hypothetical protein